MPTYTYETIPLAATDVVERFELRQTFDEPALEAHPVTGVPVRRVISGGMGLVSKTSGQRALPEAGPGCGPETCHCGRFS
jgi:predicted nucleic acid-binding Zn ribbon protein